MKGGTDDVPVTILTTSYLWRCPECDTGNVTLDVSAAQVRCTHCHASWRVFEARHRTHDYDNQPGKSIGALRSQRVEISAEAALTRDDAVKERGGKYVVFEKELVVGAGVLLVATGYTWACPTCNMPNYLRSPLEKGSDLLAVGKDDLTLTCSACGTDFVAAGVRHTSHKKPLGPPVKVSAVFVPPVREVRRETALEQTR